MTDTKPEPRLLLPGLAPLYRWAEPATYTLMRAAFGLIILTHGLPKAFGFPHGSMADPMGGLRQAIGTGLGLPFAPQLAVAVTLLETLGALAVAVGLHTRLFAAMLAVEMAVICVFHSDHFVWIDRGFEYPLMLGFVALNVAIRGGGAWSVDRRLVRTL